MAKTDSKAEKYRPNVLLVHGEKGGVGKSSAVTLAASRAIYRGWPVHVIETDGSIPDVGPRFNGKPGCTVSSIDLSADVEAGEKVVDLANWLEELVTGQTPPRLIVINSPAGSAGVLDNYSSIFGALTAETSATLTVAFMIDGSSAVLPIIEASLARGILSLAGARRALVYAGWEGNSSSFPIAASVERGRALQAGLVEFSYPALLKKVYKETVQKTQVPLYSLLGSESGVRMAERSMIAKWLSDAEPLADWLIGAEAGND